MRLATTEASSAERASTWVILFSTEFMKMLMSLCFLAIEEGFSFVKAFRIVKEDLQNEPREALQMAIPAAIYAVQNALLQWSVGNLPAALWQVTYQGKILVTAVFSVVLLRKKFKRSQWLAMAIMGGGIAIVQLSNSTESKQADMANAAEQQFVSGLIMLLLACCCSGFASVFTEMVFKQVKAGNSGNPPKKKSVWLQNTHLAAFSLVPILGSIIFNGSAGDLSWIINKSDVDMSTRRTLFTGFTAKTWAMAINNAIGGLLVALVIKHADNILRGFSSSLATINASLLSVFFFGFSLSAMFGLGTTSVNCPCGPH
jgi:UDP-sugar transporter A1/2/3